MRTARMARLVLLSVILAAAPLAGGLGCGGSKPGESEAAADEEPVSEQGKKWGGWRWKGKRNNCFFKVENECHDSLEKACKAAKCKKSECVHDSSAPAVVSCKK